MQVLSRPQDDKTERLEAIENEAWYEDVYAANTTMSKKKNKCH